MKVIDLSQLVTNETMPFPGDPYSSIKKMLDLHKDGSNVYQYSTILHTGTHVDAPMHMTDDSRFISEFDVNQFCGNGVLFDVRGYKHITLDCIDINRVSQGDIVLFYTGYDSTFGTEDYYGNHPSIEPEVAQALVKRGIKMLGVDMTSPDHEPYEIHQIIFEHDVISLESLTNLEALLNIDSFFVFALPIKLSAEASQVRAVAVYDM